MTSELRMIILAALLPAVALTGGAPGGADRQAPALQIHVSDHAGLESATLARARAQTEEAFAAAGVRVLWMDFEEGPQTASCEGLNVFVTLLSPRELSQQGIREDVLSWADRESGRAFISPRRLGQLAAEGKADEGWLLGSVITHEAGHLLRPESDRSPAGVATDGTHIDPAGMPGDFALSESQAIRQLVESKAGSWEGLANCGKLVSPNGQIF